MDRHGAMRTLLEVVRQGSFAGAARSLGLTRAYVSRTIAQLEEELGVRLFHRTTRSMSPTHEALGLCERIEPVLQQWDEVLGSVGPSGEPRGKLRVAGPRNFGERVLAPIVAEYASRYPEVRVELSLQDRRVALVEEGFDVAVRIATMRDATHLVRRFGTTPLVLVASPGYLACAGRPARPEDLSGHRAVVDANLDTRTRWPLIADGTRQLIEVTPAISVNSPSAARCMVEAGAGIGMLTLEAVHDALERGDLERVLPECDVDLSFDIHAIYPAGRYLAPRVKLLLDMISERVRRVG